MAKRVALYGIGGLYNYGCEAIVRGCVWQIRQAEPDAEITYYTPCITDKKTVSDLNIHVSVIADSQKKVFRRAFNKISRELGATVYWPYPVNREIIENSDIVFSIGGDMYAIAQYLRNRKKYIYYNPLVQFGEEVLRKGKKLIIIGASVGPFGDYPKAVSYYADHLRKCNAVFCREMNSMSYLRSIHVEQNVRFLPDPAFFVLGSDEPECGYEDADFIGVNLSPLSFYETYGKLTDKVIEKIANTLCSWQEKLNCPFLLIPHVISSKENDNDEFFLRKICERIPPKKQKLFQVQSTNGFLDAKKYVKKCRMVIAARMHCGVNAVCEGVPTLFLAYSIKAKGMAELIYQSHQWDQPLTDMFTPEFEDKLLNMYENRSEIHSYLNDRIRQIRNNFDADLLANYMNLEFENENS